MPAPLVSLILLAHNKSCYTELALSTLLQSSWPSLQAILVDNGSTDNTPAIFARFAVAAEARGWQVDIIHCEENKGAVAGRNLALRRVRGEFVVMQDNDVVVGRRTWVERMLASLEKDKRIGVLGPQILFAASPHLIQCAGCVVGRGGRVGFRGRGEPRDTPEFQHRAEVQALISAFWIMPRRAVDETGDFDMLFHPVQFEDIDYCYRLRQAGWIAVYDPCVHVFHFENVTTGGTPALNYRYLTVKNGLKFKNKWRHVFSKENGPEDAKMIWREIPTVLFEQVGSLPLLD